MRLGFTLSLGSLAFIRSIALRASLFILIQVGSQFATAQRLDRNMVLKAKAATAMVIKDDSSGTAFCFDIESRLFATNAHVAGRIGERVTLVLNSGESNEMETTGIVIHSSQKLDLAVVRSDSVENVLQLPLGSSSSLNVGDRLWAIGYPLGELLKTDSNKHPNISFSGGTLTSIRRDRGNVDRLQLDAEINPGNSGGPSINSNGEVIGINTSKVSGTNLNFAIPIEFFARFLEEPSIDYTPPKVRTGLGPISVEVLVGPIGSQHSGVRGSVTTYLGGVEGTTFPLALNGDKLSTTLPDVRGKTVAKVTIEAGGRRIDAEIADVEIAFGEIKKRVSEIYAIQFRPQFKVLFRDGTNEANRKISTKSLPIRLEGRQRSLNLGKVDVLRFEAVKVPKLVELKVDVFQKDRQLLSQRDIVLNERKSQSVDGWLENKSKDALGNQTNASDNFSVDFQLARLPEYERLTIDLSSRPDRHCIGRMGELWIFRQPYEKKTKLEVLDLVRGGVVHQIPIANISTLFAADSEYLYTCDPDIGRLEQWSLENFELVHKRKLEIDLPIHGMVAGPCSKERLLIANGGQTRAGSYKPNAPKYGFILLNTQDLGTVQTPDWKPAVPAEQSAKNCQLRSSPSGACYFLYNSGAQYILSHRLKWPRSVWDNSPVGYKSEVNFLGDRFLSPELTLTPWQSEDLDSGRDLDFRVPGISSSLELHLYQAQSRTSSLTGFTYNFGSDLHDSNPLARIENIPNPTGGLFFNDQLDFVAVYHDQNQITLINSNCQRSNQQTGASYVRCPKKHLFEVEPGSSFSTHLIAETDRQPLEYVLQEAPPGLTVSTAGKLSWSVPRNRNSVYRAKVRASQSNGIYGDFEVTFYTRSR